jgi:hypothetical protein
MCSAAGNHRTAIRAYHDLGSHGPDRSLIKGHRIIASPHFEMRPIRSISPDWCLPGVRPKCAPMARGRAKRVGTSTVARNVRPTSGPTPGHSHETTVQRIFTSKADKQVVKLSEPLSERSGNCQERGYDHH